MSVMLEVDGPGRGRRRTRRMAPRRRGANERAACPSPSGRPEAAAAPPPDPPLSLQSKLPKMDGDQAALFMTKTFT